MIFLWCIPRSVSTAFEKMMASSGRFAVHGEPFIDFYKRSLLSQKDCEQVQIDFDKACADFMKQSTAEPVFVKDMAYHALPFVQDEFLRSVTHTFLIRDPKYSIPSLYKMRPEFSADQVSLEGQYQLFNKLHNLNEKLPLVIDSERLKAQPQVMVAKYFKYIGMDMPKDILNWAKGSREDWVNRESWHIDAINSTGYENRTSAANLDELPHHVVELIEENQQYYKALLEFAE